MSGECILTSVYNPERDLYDIHINRADPHILIVDELLHRAWLNPDTHPQVTLKRPTEGHGSTGHGVGDYDCSVPAGGRCFYDSVLTIRGTNQTVIYRIGRYDWERNVWEASWPD